MTAYAADKARALIGEVAIAVVDDGPAAAPARRRRPRQERSGSPPAARCRRPARRAWTGCWSTGRSAPARCCRGATSGRPGAHNVTNALAAAALALAAGVDGAAVAAGLRTFEPGGHRNVAGRRRSTGCAMSTTPRPPTRTPRRPRCWPTPGWCGSPAASSRATSVDDLVSRSRTGWPGWCCSVSTPRSIDAALSRHAPDVPRIDGARNGRWGDGAGGAGRYGDGRPGDVVLLAPAAACLDMFTSYAARGRRVRVAVPRPPDRPGAR